MTPKLETFYKDGTGQWRWRFIDKSNGKILADSAEGYRKLIDCERAHAKVTGQVLIELLQNDLQLCLNTIHIFQSGRKIQLEVRSNVKDKFTK